VTGLRLIVSAFAIALLLAPQTTLGVFHVFLLAGFGLLVVWRLVLVVTGFFFGWRSHPSLPVTPLALPRYTVLVALYREQDALPGLVSSLSALDYPASRMEVFFLVEEEDDDGTRDALSGMPPPPHFHIVTVPDGQPRTKPRALNFGLSLATGTRLVIYDAEDRPHRHQLRAAVAQFAASGRQTACLQAPLIAYNTSESWPAAQWGLEYLVHFGLIVPALARLGLPVPLGGTSNHFDVDILRKFGGWDAWNVTEDADLGLRLARNGYHIGVVRPPTLEEAPIGPRTWTAQRSRWLKGHAQTWLVAIRRRAEAARLGALQWAAIHLMLAGAVASAALHPWLAAGIVAALLVPGLALTGADWAVLAAGIAVNALAAFLAGLRSGRMPVLALLTQPLYWPLHSLAAARALFGLFSNPISGRRPITGSRALSRCLNLRCSETQTDRLHAAGRHMPEPQPHVPHARLDPDTDRPRAQHRSLRAGECACGSARRSAAPALDSVEADDRSLGISDCARHRPYGQSAGLGNRP